MTTLHRTVTTTADPDVVFDYLVDFANAEEWDSGTVSCVRLSGTGGIGSVYRNVSAFMGQTVELEYVVTEADYAARRFVVEGRNATTTSRDTIVVAPAVGGGSTVDYTADFPFAGPARFLGPVLRLPLEGLARRTAAQLTDVLNRL